MLDYVNIVKICHVDGNIELWRYVYARVTLKFDLT